MTSGPRAFQVVDLAYGDCGKGTIVDFLTRRFDVRAVVRFNGGPQAGHNVITPDGRHHTFAQFGSGSFVPGVRTLLSRFMLIEPYALFREAQHLETVGIRDAMKRLEIDARCLVITPPQIAANRLRELARGASAHGTCGMGVGEAMKDSIETPALALRAGDLGDRRRLTSRLREIADHKLAELREIIDACQSIPRAGPSIETLRDFRWIDAAVETYVALAREAAIVESLKIPTDDNIIFEGAQGVLLDETAGFQPHTTWSNTTFGNADRLLDEVQPGMKRIRIGVLRSYFTRHGPGPFVTEDESLGPLLAEPHNDGSGWQGAFRVGHFDAVAARYAIETCGGVNCLALTHLDRVPSLPARVCDAYLLDGCREARLGADTPLARCRPVYASVANDSEAFANQIADRLGATIGIRSFGLTHVDKSIATDSWL